jgi:hypothetical protein
MVRLDIDILDDLLEEGTGSGCGHPQLGWIQGQGREGYEHPDAGLILALEFEMVGYPIETEVDFSAMILAIGDGILIVGRTIG